MPNQEETQHTISVMLAVSDAAAASRWYQDALGAVELWNLGSVVGLEFNGAPFFIAQPEYNGWDTPTNLGLPSSRVEVFCDDPETVVARDFSPLKGLASRLGR